MNRESEPKNILPQSDGTPPTPTKQSKANNTIWEDGKKPDNEDKAFKECKSFFAPLWEAIHTGRLIDESDFHPVKPDASEKPPTNPTENG